MKANGIRNPTSVTAVVTKSGKTVASTKDTGKMIWPMEREDLSMQTARSTKECGKMIKLMDLEHTLTKTVPSTQGSGIQTNSTESVLKPGLMVPSIVDPTTKERSMERDSSSGQTSHLTTEISKTIISRVKASTSGLMVVSITATG